MIKDLEARKPIDSIELEIVDMEEPREWSNHRGSATGKDTDGNTVKVTFWNDDVDKVKKGDKIKIENGWASEFNGEIQVSTGRFGKLTVNP